MKILYIYDGDWPKGATRPTKQTKSFVRGGHMVRLLARNDFAKPRFEQTVWMTVVRLPSVPFGALNRVINFPYFFNPFWLFAIWNSAREFGTDCLVVRDLPLALTAVWAGRLLGLPVHFDMAEVYPEFLRSLWEFDDMGWLDHLVRNPAAAEWLERRVLPKVASVFVVSEESRTRCRVLGVADERIYLVGNTPGDVTELVSRHPRPPDIADLAGRPTLLFVGTVIGDRGVVLTVQAMPAILRELPDAVFVVVGDGPERPKVEAAVAALGLEKSVRLLGWKNHAELAPYYGHCDLGLLPFLDGSHVRITFANKLFDYMGAALPVVASDLPPMRRILDETHSGLTFPPGDRDALARVVVELIRDPARRKAMGAGGQQAVLTKYRWSEDEKRLLAAVAGLPAQHSE